MTFQQSRGSGSFSEGVFCLERQELVSFVNYVNTLRINIIKGFTFLPCRLLNFLSTNVTFYLLCFFKDVALIWILFWIIIEYHMDSILS